MSVVYKNTLDPLQWRCQHGHEWRSRPQHILKGHWCPRCAKPFRYSLDDMRAYARSRGGECVSDAYHGSEKALRWRCQKRHVWNGAPANVVRRETWCPRCAGHRRTLRDLRRLAWKRGGECLSVRYLRNEHVHLWQCEQGHKFVKTLRSVRDGTWCFDCTFYEKYSRWPKNSRAASEREILRETGALGETALHEVVRHSDFES